ncbi:MAG: peptidylprolyl isomerase [wastewater metagenome]|nr:peptidylprolyl isomerase [Candidatus Loosdrechtia aerotolerans]
MVLAKYGDTVRIHYKGRLEDGSVFESSFNDGPLKFTIGDGHVIKGLEEAVIGMKPGEAKTIRVSQMKAHGSYNEDLIVSVDRSEFSSDLKLTTGQKLDICQDDGSAIIATVIDISEAEVTLDMNHPLAGKDLTFDIKLIEIMNPLRRKLL